MDMKFFRNLFLSLLILTSPLFAQSNFDLEQDVGKIHIMTMDNGFTVFVKEDPSSAMIHAELLCKAGYTSQTPSTAGFFPLYARLFSTTKRVNGNQSFSSVPLISSCNTDSSTFTADVIPEGLENLIKDFAQCAMNPKFSDTDILNQFNALKKESEYNAKDATGFINSAIDSKIFAQSPWKNQSGIYPALFSSYNLEEIKTILKDIQDRFYNPDNCGIFITGNISAAKAYNLVLKYFGKWEGKTKLQRNADSLKKEISNQKKFVLVDKDFSKDLTQIVVQYTKLSATEADVMNSAFNSYNSPYKNLMLENPKVSVRSREYLASSSQHNGGYSRLILQALMEEPYSFSTEPGPQNQITPADQAEEFLKTLVKSSELSDHTFDLAKNSVSADYRKKVGNSVGSMQIVADWWAMDSTYEGDKNFYERYLTLPSSVDSLEKDTMQKNFQNEAPFVFVLVNSNVYNQFKDSFVKNNYQLITKENGSWYHNQVLLAQALENEKEVRNQKIKMQTPMQELEDLSPASNFYLQNLIQFEEGVLENGIPLVVKNSPHSQTVAISLAIDGGEASSPKDQRLLRTVLINSYARNLQDQFTFMKSSGQIAGSTSITAVTEQTVSYVTVECVKTDFLNVMSAMVNALVYGDISESNADRLVNEQAAVWSSKMMNLDSQMEYDAMKYLFRDTLYSDLYDSEAKVLSDTKIVNIGLAYTELLDASIFSIAIAGDTDLKESTKIGNQTFGILREQSQRKTKDSIPIPSFKTSVRRVKLHHLYTTTLTKEQAGTEVPILIPTSDFYDPVQYFFPVPEESHQRNLYNCLLEEMKNRIQKYLPENVTCSTVSCTNLLNIASLRVNGILHTKDFLTAYKKARLQLISDLEIPSDDLIFDLKQKWISRTMIQTQTNLGTVELIQKGCQINMPQKYLDDYLSMELCDRLDFLEVMKNYFPENPSFTITSVDSKN